MQASTTTYRSVSLGWNPAANKNERCFTLITLVITALLLSLAVFINSIELPTKPRQRLTQVPDRIAQYISERPKPKLIKPKVISLPPPKPKPKVARQSEAQAKKNKLLTHTQKKARQIASETGLLALGNELADLMDTSHIDAMVTTKVRSGANNVVAATLGTQALTKGVGEGVASVSTADHLAAVGHTQLAGREKAEINQALFKSLADNDGVLVLVQQQHAKRGDGDIGSSHTRSEESISITFDQNKGILYSIYNRERRKNISLRGKIIFELSIAPSGKVIVAKVISSELNDASLERRLLARIKQFNFGKQEAQAITVTFPVEFLPS